MTYNREKYLSEKRRRHLGIDYHQRENSALVVKLKIFTEEMGFSAQVIADVAHVDKTTLTRMVTRKYLTSNYKVYEALDKLRSQDLYSDTLLDIRKVAAYASQRRIKALYRIGYSRGDIDELLRQEGDFGHLVTKNILAAPKSISMERHRAVKKVYDKIAYRPGKDKAGAERAALLGYPSPLAWDDIEDYYEIPQGM